MCDPDRRQCCSFSQKLSLDPGICSGTRKSFCAATRSYIVNLAHVRTLEDTFFRMEDGTSVPISRAFYKEAKNAYYHYRLR
ncbi:MAG: LytTR family transcriptional regulator DNA-binding domain-containing protein [Clostridium sp.]